ncbi:MAG: hypothetical protein ACXVR9_02670 [Gaiellaceae bacterium]
MAKKDLPTLSGPKVTQEVIGKAATLVKQVRPLGHPRAIQGDLIGALIDAATPETAAKALDGYNPKLGKALAELEDG